MRVSAGHRTLFLASLAVAVAQAPSVSMAGIDDHSIAVEHVTTSTDTGGTRYRARTAPAAEPVAAAPVTAAPAAVPAAPPVPPAPPRPAAPPAPAKATAVAIAASTEVRAAQARSGATVRKRPALDGQVLARLSAGTSVEIETELRNDEDAWWYVSTPTVSGWIAASELSVN